MSEIRRTLLFLSLLSMRPTAAVLHFSFEAGCYTRRRALRMRKTSDTFLLFRFIHSSAQHKDAHISLTAL